jgi:hypothetical protein
MKPFSLSHFSRVLLRMGRRRVKKACLSGLAWVPGPCNITTELSNMIILSRVLLRMGRRLVKKACLPA